LQASRGARHAAATPTADEQLSSLRLNVGALAIAVWEFSLGVYLAVKGFKPSPGTDRVTPADARLKPAADLDVQPLRPA
jgi:hypothetical protein